MTEERIQELLEIANSLQNNDKADKFWNSLTKEEYNELRKQMNF
jgi:hypothetical protein